MQTALSRPLSIAFTLILLFFMLALMSSCRQNVGGEKIIARAAADFRAELETPAWVRFETDKAAFFDADSGETLEKQ